MMSCATRITIQPVAVDGIRPMYAQRGWFLGAIAEEGRIVRCSESFASEQDTWRVFRHRGNWAWSIRNMSVRNHRRNSIWIWECSSRQIGQNVVRCS